PNRYAGGILCHIMRQHTAVSRNGGNGNSFSPAVTCYDFIAGCVERQPHHVKTAAHISYSSRSINTHFVILSLHHYIFSLLNAGTLLIRKISARMPLAVTSD